MHRDTQNVTGPIFLQCTASCGGGVQARSVQCLAGGQPAWGCSPHRKPAASLACNTHYCPIAEKRDALCKDRLAWCSLAPQLRTCSPRLYSQPCCGACSRRSP